MNPIENLWAILDRAVRRYSRKPSSKADLLNMLRLALAEIPAEKIAQFTSSTSQWVKALRLAAGKSSRC